MAISIKFTQNGIAFFPIYRLVEKSDLEIAKDLLGDCTDELDNANKTNEGNVDIFNPTNEEEFIELAKMLTEKLSKLEVCLLKVWKRF